METRVIFIENGDLQIPFRYYRCAECGGEIPESSPMHVEESGETFCGECAFKKGLIDSKTYLSNFIYYISIPSLKAGINPSNGEIELTTTKFSWEKTDKDYRRDPRYKSWRTNVFKRDSFKCAICSKVGGNLEAHHIKPFKKYISERFNTDNGITLCHDCHVEVHKTKDKNWLYTE